MILGQMLFLIYVNDISSKVSSTLRMFVDDTKVYRELLNIARDRKALQFDVDQLLSCTGNYASIPHGEILRITDKRDLSLPTYSLGTSLKSVKCIKDLGIMISSDLSYSKHVNTTVKKANKLLGLVHRTVGSSDPGGFSMWCNSLLCPVLEYAALAWNPYLANDVLALERVQ